MQQHGDHGGVVHVRIVRVGVLERPTAGGSLRAEPGPVAFEVGDLTLGQPVARGGAGGRARSLGFHDGMAGERGVPDRGQARLAVGPVVADHQQLADGAPGGRRVRVVRWVAERVEHHHAVGHRRVDGAEPIVAIQPLYRERDGRVQGALVGGGGKWGTIGRRTVSSVLNTIPQAER